MSLQQPSSSSSISGSYVFHKTERGYAEFANKNGVLSPQLRRFLVFIDGLRTVDELIEMTAILGDTTTAIAALQREGYIALRSGAETPVVAHAPAANVTKLYADQPRLAAAQQSLYQSADRANLEKIKGYMIADLKDRMGRDVDLVAPKIQAAPTAEDLLVMMMRLRTILEKYSGAAEAEQFVSKFKDMLI